MASYKGTIRQSATIIHLTDTEVEVEVCRPDACAACKAKSVCSEGGASSSGRHMKLANDGQGYRLGEQIMLVMRRSAGLKAVLVAYLGPVFLIVATLLLLQALGIGELISALVTLGLVGLYFIIIRLLRGRLNQELTIEIEKENGL